ncbi:MAG TPA: hypothetical protein VK636_14595 [Gemmatimonadaceae bacterium]|nr:hypothetical protein [Gemmatimonadaceae bacterium]
MTITAPHLVRWAGVCAMIAGILYVGVGVFHPPNVLSSVTAASWTMVHILAIAMSFFGLLGMAGLYARQADKSGWLGLAGYILFSLWLALMLGFAFVETFVLPRLATVLPAFVDGFLGIFTGSASTIDLGVLPTIWSVTGPLYILGGLLFGIATFRAGILPRWAAVMLALGTALAPVAALLPPALAPKIAIPVGLGLAWLGYGLAVERRGTSPESIT